MSIMAILWGIVGLIACLLGCSVLVDKLSRRRTRGGARFVRCKTCGAWAFAWPFSRWAGYGRHFGQVDLCRPCQHAEDDEVQDAEDRDTVEHVVAKGGTYEDGCDQVRKYHRTGFSGKSCTEWRRDSNKPWYGSTDKTPFVPDEWILYGTPIWIMRERTAKEEHDHALS